MENIREEQIEALNAVYEYNTKLSNALNEIVPELRGEKKEDTREYLDHIMKGVNWVIQVVNATLPLINESEEKISKDEINGIVLKINDAFKNEDYIQLADLIETGIIPFIDNVSVIAKDITKN